MRSLRDATCLTAGLGVLLAACTTPGATQPGRGSGLAPPASSQPAPPASRASAPIDVPALPGRITFSNSTDDIWTINANGTKLRRLTTNPAHDFDPAWSPDGRMIAFRSERDGNNEVYVMRADGSRQHNVSRDPHDDWGPAWSPRGQVLWNCAGALATGFHACVARPDGSHRHRIPQDRYFEYGAWSPDGAKIAFMSQEAGASGSDPDYNIYVMNARRQRAPAAHPHAGRGRVPLLVAGRDKDRLHQHPRRLLPHRRVRLPHHRRHRAVPHRVRDERRRLRPAPGQHAAGDAGGLVARRRLPGICARLERNPAGRLRAGIDPSHRRGGGGRSPRLDRLARGLLPHRRHRRRADAGRPRPVARSRHALIPARYPP